MSSPKEITERLRKILQLEKQTGYQDTAVLGGLEGFIARMVEQMVIPSVTPLLERVKSYGAKSVVERREVVRELEDLIPTLEFSKETAHSSSAPEDSLKKPIR